MRAEGRAGLSRARERQGRLPAEAPTWRRPHTTNAPAESMTGDRDGRDTPDTVDEPVQPACQPRASTPRVLRGRRQTAPARARWSHRACAAPSSSPLRRLRVPLWSRLLRSRPSGTAQFEGIRSTRLSSRQKAHPSARLTIILTLTFRMSSTTSPLSPNTHLPWQRRRAVIRRSALRLRGAPRNSQPALSF